MTTKKELQKKIDLLQTQLNKYKEISMHDELTGLYNRRKFMRDINSACYNYSRYRTNFVTVLIDIDKFKQINDTKGHAEGDRTLKYLSNVIENNLRFGDKAYRFGGDEFAIILYNTNIKMVKHTVIKRIKEDLTFNISCGIISNHKDYTELLDIVDKRMYKDKLKHKLEV